MNKCTIVGLGNPGKKYENTRHNAGKMFIQWMKKVEEDRRRYKKVEESRRKYKKGEEGEMALVETECFMNESGEWIKKRMVKTVKMAETAKSYNNFFIVHDDLDIPLGSFKIQFAKGPLQHNGVLSVEQALGTKEFWRIRIGIDARSSGPAALQPHPTASLEDSMQALDGAPRYASPDSSSDYVLSHFSKEEQSMLVNNVFPKTRKELLKTCTL